MERIAAEAGLSKPVVYAHFGDRAGLAAALAHHTADELALRIAETMAAAGGFEATVRSTVAVFVDFADRERELFSFLLHPGGSRSPDAELHTLIETFAGYLDPLALAELEPRGRTPADVQLRVRAVLGLAYTTVDWWLREGRDDFTAHGLVEHLTAMVMAIFAVR